MPLSFLYLRTRQVYTLASCHTGIHASVVAGLGTCRYHHGVASPNTPPQYGVWSTMADPKLLDDIALVSFVGISMLAPTRSWGACSSTIDISKSTSGMHIWCCKVFQQTEALVHQQSCTYGCGHADRGHIRIPPNDS